MMSRTGISYHVTFMTTSSQVERGLKNVTLKTLVFIAKSMVADIIYAGQLLFKAE
jgi:hypothetical protein